METMLATLIIDTEKELRDISPPYFWNARITVDIVSSLSMFLSDTIIIVNILDVHYKDHMTGQLCSN